MSNGQVYKFESVKKFQKETSIHQYIAELVKQKEQLEYQSSITNGIMHSYIEGKLQTVIQVIENLTKIVYNYQKFN